MRSNQNEMMPLLPFSSIMKIEISGPAVSVGVTLYVLSISALSEVEMVLFIRKTIEMIYKCTLPLYCNRIV